jgi:glutathione S-transferase
VSIHLYSLSGSPFGWKVQLALEHLGVVHGTSMLSPEAGDTRQPAFLAMNPHGKLPVLVDGDVVLYESDVIVEYLEEKYGRTESSLWPTGPAARALARRAAAEANAYLYPALRTLVTSWVATTEPDLDRSSLDAAKHSIAQQFEILASRLTDGFMASGQPGAADYAVYPLLALLRRLNARRPGEALTRLVPSAITAWAGRIEALPFLSRTLPPHWRTSP